MNSIAIAESIKSYFYYLSNGNELIDKTDFINKSGINENMNQALELYFPNNTNSISLNQFLKSLLNSFNYETLIKIKHFQLNNQLNNDLLPSESDNKNDNQPKNSDVGNKVPQTSYFTHLKDFIGEVVTGTVKLTAQVVNELKYPLIMIGGIAYTYYNLPVKAIITAIPIYIVNLIKNEVIPNLISELTPDFFKSDNTKTNNNSAYQYYSKPVSKIKLTDWDYTKPVDNAGLTLEQKIQLEQRLVDEYAEKLLLETGSDRYRTKPRFVDQVEDNYFVVNPHHPQRFKSQSHSVFRYWLHKYAPYGSGKIYDG